MTTTTITIEIDTTIITSASLFLHVSSLLSFREIRGSPPMRRTFVSHGKGKRATPL